MKKKVKFTSNINMEYSSKNINKGLKYYDKALGVKMRKLGNNNKKLSKKRKSLETKIHNSLIEINCVVGGVPIRLDKINGDKRIKKVKNYVKNSNIDYTTKSYNTNDLMFRRKFVVLCTSRIIKNEKKILNRLSKPYIGKKNYEKFRMIKDHDFFCTYLSFVSSVVSQKNTITDDLFDMFYILNKKNISSEVNRYRFRVLKGMNKSYKQIFGRKRSYKLIGDIFNTALLLGCGSSSVKKFNIKDFKGCCVEDDLGYMIRKLGRKIIKSGVSEMFLTYLQCNPKVRTMYIKEVREDDAMVIGLMALAFTDYMFSQANIHYVIRLLLRRPWTNEEQSKKQK